MTVGRALFSVFDVHLWAKSIDATSLRPEIAFFGDAAAYRAMRQTGKAQPVNRLLAFPLDGELAHSHFWPPYFGAAYSGGGVDAIPPGPSDFLIPLRCRPQGLDLKFKAPALNQTVKVRATIWLWPFGWSSMLEFAIKGPLDFNAIRVLHEAVQSQNAAPFSLDSKAISLSDVFKFLREMVRQDVVLPGKVPTDFPAVARQTVLSAWLSKGLPARLYELDGTPALTWSNGDQMDMLGALLAKPIGFPEFKALEKEPRKYFVTRWGRGDFAITHFDRGTLIVLRHWVDGKRKHHRDTNHCLTSNIRTFSMVASALMKLIKDRTPSGANAPSPGLGADARALLDGLAKFYTNPICKKYLGKHSGIN